MMNIYIAQPFSAGSRLSQPIRDLKNRLSVLPYYEWNTIALPHTRELLERAYTGESLLFSFILDSADVLVVDRGLVDYDVPNPHLPLFNDLVDHGVLLIVCSQAENKAASPDILNIGIDKNNLFLLQYERSIGELYDYILNAIAKHSIFLQTTKPLLKK